MLGLCCADASWWMGSFEVRQPHQYYQNTETSKVNNGARLARGLGWGCPGGGVLGARACA